MTEKEKKILKTFKETVPKLSEKEKGELLAFAAGMAFAKDKEAKKVACND